ncbi:alpha/beta hydrolase fold domain-containing protein [Sarocladium implicatum]|nr:alpha/beta hydrolase fold domain-containing protein [Sarocladium implicatum]
MDYEAADVPPIPMRTHSSSHKHNAGRRKSLPTTSATPKRRSAAQPTSPEVISNLISSLSIISQPSSNYFDADPSTNSLSVPASPGLSGSGSFGVDYGAYSTSGALEGVREEPVSLDELAASSPVIRTAKPPSGFSTHTAPKTPSRESGLRSFMRSSSSANPSRPSSPGSINSRNDDAQSIGNLSVERGSAPTPELKRRRSHDSWGKKTNRSQKGLMYMSSRERLRENNYDRKQRGSGGAGVGGAGTGSSSNHSGGRGDPFLAETAISEEPGNSASDRGMDTARHIPARDSSLRKTGSSSKRSSARKSKREQDGSLADIIAEVDESFKTAQEPTRRSRSSVPTLDPLSFGNQQNPSDGSSALASKERRDHSYSGDAQAHTGGELDEDGAPFPAVSQGRRREDHSAEGNGRRRSGRHSPGPGEAIKLKRSSSRLKRLSGQLSPRPDDESRGPSTDAQRPPPPAGYERPQSADSVDDAVESYLCSPRLSQKIRHPQTGRTISFSEVGDANGSAVFCCVGMGLTRYITAFYDELALTLKLRLITPDRPGVGDSEAYTDGTATPLGWPDDVYAICQALKITKFSILAHSAGAIYALATALRMPQHIRGRIHLLAPWIPPSQMNVFGASQSLPPTNAIPTSQRILRALPTPFLKAANSSFMTATSSSITSSLPKNPRRTKRKASAKEPVAPASNLDQENIGQPGHGKGGKDTSHADANIALNDIEHDRPNNTGIGGDATILAAAADAMADRERQVTYDARLTHAIWELATTGANPAVDLLVCLERRHTIGFRYVDITRPVVVHHGSRDTRVPVDNARWLGKTMRRCEVRVLEGEGHGLMASASVMGSVLMEISKEWEDWMRVTGADGRKDRERGRRGTIGR